MDSQNTHDPVSDGQRSEEGLDEPSSSVLYTVEDTPPWYLCLLLGFQHYLTAVGAIISIPILLSEHFCMDKDKIGLSELIGTIFFVSGIATLLQTTFGVRLPIVQGGTFSFMAPTIAIMSQTQWSCPYSEARNKYKSALNLTALDLPEIGSDEHREMWMKRIREIQGAIMVASIFEVVIGFSGVIGLVLRYIGPLSITPTISLIGLSLFSTVYRMASQQWWISLLTMCLIIACSQYLRNLNIPCCTFQRGKGCTYTRLPFFSLFPVLFAMIISWIVCAILTVTNVFPIDPDKWGYAARTDTSIDVLVKAKWFRFPYPGQWGRPTVAVASVFGMLAGVLASMVESIGDYYACARLSGAPPPPTHAVNRGIGIEGIACILAGAWGSGNGTTSYSENIGAIGITKVGSLRVVQVGGILMLILGCLGKFGALFATIPGPVIGGMFMITFGMVTAVGLSNLQYVDLNSPRNIFILGVSIFFGLSLPVWMEEHTSAINTGSNIADQIFTVLLSTSMFVGGAIGFVLDNTIPGTDKERGIFTWRKLIADNSLTDQSRMHIYDLPLIQKHLNSMKLLTYFPACPQFLNNTKRKSETQTHNNEASQQMNKCEEYINNNLTVVDGTEINTWI